MQATDLLNQSMDPIKLFKCSIFLFYTLGLLLNWSDTGSCLRPAYIANCLVFLVFATRVPKFFKFEITLYVLCIIWWVLELSMSEKEGEDESCPESDQTFFQSISLIFFRICLWFITLIAVLPALRKHLCTVHPENLDRHIPLTRYTKKSLRMNDQAVNPQTAQTENVCSICLEKFKENEDVRRVPNCSHLFHPHCIKKWLQNQTNCPNCRREILEMEKKSQHYHYEPPHIILEPISEAAPENELSTTMNGDNADLNN